MLKFNFNCTWDLTTAIVIIHLINFTWDLLVFLVIQLTHIQKFTCCSALDDGIEILDFSFNTLIQKQFLEKLVLLFGVGYAISQPNNTQYK